MYTRCLALALVGLLASGSHLRFGSIDWTVPDPVNSPRRVRFHWFEAVRGNLESAFAKNIYRDPEQEVCPTTTNCWRLSQWNGYFQFGEGQSGDRYTYHLYGSTPRFDSATSSRTYSDGSVISTGYQNWWMTERVLYKDYSQTQTYTSTYDTCCRQTSGVRNINTGQDFTLKAQVVLSQVANGIYQNPHCSAFPIYFWPFGNANTPVLNLNNLCSTPHDPSLTFAWSTGANSGLVQNGDVNWAGYTNPTLNGGSMSWQPSHDGLYALQFTVTDDYGNTNVLDIIFDVSTAAPNTSPYFVEVRDSYGGSTPTSTVDIYNVPAKTVAIGQTIQLGVWGYAPTGSVTQITYAWSYSAQSSISDTCNSNTQYCELQFSYTPSLGQTSRNLCVIVVSTLGSYVGAPSDPSNEVTFCITINVEPRKYIYLSGFVRDFRPADSATTGMVTTSASSTPTDANFVLGDLSTSFKPQFDSSASATTVTSSQFAYWFGESAYSSRVTVSITLGLISGVADQPGSVYEGDFNPWYPINCAGFDSSISNCQTETQLNKYFTYEVNTHFEFATGISVSFETTDYLWVFIDGKLVLAYTTQSASPVAQTLNFDSLTLVNPSTPGDTLVLQAGQSYGMSLFFVHRSTEFNPQLKWQIPGGSVCDAVSGGNTTFSIDSFSGMSNSIYDTQNGAGMIAISGTKLRLASNSLTSSSAVYYAVAGAAKKFHVRDGFETTFRYEIDACSSGCTGTSVPGFAFVIQGEGPSARGGAAAGLGYEGIQDAVVIEFDGISDATKSDPTYSHGSYHVSSGTGSAASAVETTAPAPAYASGFDLSLGAVHTIKIQYLPGQFQSASSVRLGWIYIYVDDELTPKFEYAVSSADFDKFVNNAYIGFTAGTTAVNAVPIYIQNWSFKVVQPSATLTNFASKSLVSTAGIQNAGNIIKAQDSCGSPIVAGGDAARFSATLISGSITVPCTIVDQNTGSYAVSFTATIAGTYTMTVTFDDTPINSGSNSLSIVVSPSDTVSLTQSYVGAIPSGLVVGEISMFSIILRDEYGNIITNDVITSETPSVTISVTPDPTTFSNAGIINTLYQPSTHNYTVNITSKETRSGGFVVRVASSGNDITGGAGSPQMITFAPGTISLPNCYIDSTDPPATALTAGTSAKFYVGIADSLGNAITTQPTGYTVGFTVQTSLSDSLCSTCTSDCSFSSGQQKYECSYYRHLAGDYNITAQLYLSGSLQGEIPNSMFSLSISASVDSNMSSIVPAVAGSPLHESPIVGNTRVFYVQSKDQYGNMRSSPNSFGAYSISFSPSVTGSAITGPDYQSGGRYTFSYSVTNATTYSNVTATISHQNNGGGIATRIMSGIVADGWLTGPVVTFGNSSSLTASVGASNVITLVLRDAYGNIITEDQSSKLSILIQFPNSASDYATIAYSSGSYSATWTTVQSGPHTLEFYVNSVAVGSSISITVAPGPTMAGSVFSQDMGLQPQKQNVSSAFRLRALDMYGNDVGANDGGSTAFKLNVIGPSPCDQQITPSYTGSGIYNFSYENRCKDNETVTLNITLNGKAIYSSSYITVQADAVPGKSVVTPGTVFTLKSGIEFPFTITAKTNGGGLRTSDNDMFSFQIETISLNFTDSSYSPPMPVATATPGSSSVSVSGLQLAYTGRYRMRIFDGLETVESSTTANGFSGPGYLIIVQPGAPARFLAAQANTYASNVQVNGAQINSVALMAGQTGTLKVNVFDAYRAPIISGVHVYAAVTVNGIVTNVTGTLNNGLWDIILSETMAGTHSFVVYAGGVAVGPSSYSYVVSAGNPYGNTTSVSLSTAEVRAGTLVTITTCFKDLYNNTAVIPAYNMLKYTLTGSLGKVTNFGASAESAIANSNPHCFDLTFGETVVDSYTLSGMLSNVSFSNTKAVNVINSLSIGGVGYSMVTGLNNVVAGTSYSFMLEVKDVYNNSYQFRSIDQNTFRVAVVEPKKIDAITLGDGAVYNSNGQWTISVDGCLLSSTTCAATCHACDAGTYIFRFFIGAVEIFSGTSYSMTVTAATPAGNTISYLYNPDPANATALQAGVTSTGISFQTYDYFGNPVAAASDPGANIEVKVFYAVPPCNSEDLSSGLPVSTNFTLTTTYGGGSNGIYTTTIYPKTMGVFYLGVLYDGQPICGGYTTLVVASAKFRPNNTDALGYSNVEVNQNGTFTLSFKDSFGNIVNSDSPTSLVVTGLQGFNLASSGFTKDGHQWKKTLGAVSSTTFTYSTTIVGSYPFNISVNDVQLLNYESSTGSSIPMIETTVGRISDFVVSPFQDVRTARYGYVSIKGKDAFGNNITDNSHTVALRFTRGAGVPYSVSATVYNEVNGVSFLRFLFELPGIYSPSITITNSSGYKIHDGTPLSLLTVSASTCAASTNGAKPYRCLNNSCVSSYSMCSEAATTACANLAETKCWDGSCAANTTACPCPGGQTRCPTGACQPTGTCLFDQLCTGTDVLCQSPRVCRASFADCPSPRTCTLGFVACPDGNSCARSYAQCQNFTKSACPNVNQMRCADGSCALAIDDCPTPTTCPSGQSVCPDGSCQANPANCPEIYECEGSLVNNFRCQDGSCVLTAADCPSSAVCPPSYVKCQDGSCATSFSACSSFTRGCLANQTTCPDGSCARNPISCPTKSTCPPSSSIRCPDGACVAVQSLCNTPLVCSQVTCPDGSCVTDKKLCPTGRSCLDEFPVLCSDGSCHNSSAYCPETRSCSESEVRCSTGVCRTTVSECPTLSTCPRDYPVRCPDQSCRVTADSCISSSKLKCASGKIRCPSGECAENIGVCPTPITCQAGYRRCVDGTCRMPGTCPEETSEGTEPSPCAANKIQCPQSAVGFSCRDSLSDCPLGIVCPVNKKVRCIDNSCKERIEDCPKSPSSWSPRVVCADGSYETQADFCGAAVSCLPTSPFTCWDSTCRLSHEDCPPTPTCSGNAQFLCPDGTCRTSPWLCRSIITCPSVTPVRCPNPADGCVATLEDCSDPYSTSVTIDLDLCPTGTVRCQEGYCAKPSECNRKECPSYLPVQCPSGLCAADSEGCEAENGCPSSKPTRCWDGSCVDSASSCANSTGSNAITCENGYSGAAGSMVCIGSSCALGSDPTITNRRACNDGSCQAIYSGGSTDYSSCPGVTSSNPMGGYDGCEESATRCLDGTCVSTASDCIAASGGYSACPAISPYLCPGGFCAKGKKLCPTIGGTTTCPIGLLRCSSGDCVSDLLQCPLVRPCLNKVRCADGTCKETRQECPLVNKCPTGYNFRCQTGECASGPQACQDPSTGCPGSLSYRCDNGACVESASGCTNVTQGVTASGCATGQVKCWNQQCKSSIFECPATNGCPSTSRYRCADGTCAANPASCLTNTCSGVICADGSCVTSAALCKTSYLCNVTTPIRCADGSCAEAGSSFALTSGSSTTVCPTIVVCPGQVTCADGSCQQTESLCPSTGACPSNMPYLCPDSTCSTSQASCGAGTTCPNANPLLCSSGSCVSSPLDCTLTLMSCPDGQVQCFDGTCANSYTTCVALRNSIGSSARPSTLSVRPSHKVALQAVNPTGCGSGQYMCSDGSCVVSSARNQCPVLAACTEALPYRCGDGTCVANQQACSAASCGGLTTCADGSCRAEADCPKYDGCGVGEYICWAEQTCSSSLSSCNNFTTSYSQYYIISPNIKEIGVCTENCYRDLRPIFIGASIDPTQDTTVRVVDDATLGQAVTLNIPSGAFNASDSAAQYLYVGPASDSDLRGKLNIVRREYFERLGEIIQHSRTLLSAPFYCWKSTNVQTFSLNVTVTASIDRTYPHASTDICLASLNQYGEWRCLFPTADDREANPLQLTDGTATGTFGDCGSVGGEGKVYAFIYAPGRITKSESDNTIGSFIERWWFVIASGCIVIAILFIFMIYYIYRKLRYRNKYKTWVDKNKDKAIELKRMKEVGAGGANVGGVGDVAMEKNPLQITIDNVNNLQSLLPSSGARKKRFEEEEKVKKKREEYIGILEKDNEKLLKVVESLRGEMNSPLL